MAGRNWVRNEEPDSEINDLLQNEDIIRSIKSQRIQRFGHIQRIEDSRLPKRILNEKVFNTRDGGGQTDNFTDDLSTTRISG